MFHLPAVWNYAMHNQISRKPSRNADCYSKSRKHNVRASSIYVILLWEFLQISRIWPRCLIAVHLKSIVSKKNKERKKRSLVCMIWRRIAFADLIKSCLYRFLKISLKKRLISVIGLSYKKKAQRNWSTVKWYWVAIGNVA